MQKLRVLDLFSGIGGFSLGLERTGGFETVAFCEIDPVASRVLANHWPSVKHFNDVRQLSASSLSGYRIDAICGGFPCQDASVANTSGEGASGDRTGLFSEIVRLAGELGVQFILMENVTNLLNRGFGDVLGALASIRFDAEWECISARELGFDHERDRLFILAYPQCARRQGPQPLRGALGRAKASLSKPVHEALGARRAMVGRERLLRNGDGLSVGMERRRLHACGNAVIPQKIEAIGNAILDSLASNQSEAA